MLLQGISAFSFSIFSDIGLLKKRLRIFLRSLRMSASINVRNIQLTTIYVCSHLDQMQRVQFVYGACALLGNKLNWHAAEMTSIQGKKLHTQIGLGASDLEKMTLLSMSTGQKVPNTSFLTAHGLMLRGKTTSMSAYHLSIAPTFPIFLIRPI